MENKIELLHCNQEYVWKDVKDLEPVPLWRGSSDPENPTLPIAVSYDPKATLDIVHNILEIAFVFLVLHFFF